MKKHWALVVVLLALACFCAIAGAYSWRSADMVYTGSESFATQGEYRAFLDCQFAEGVETRFIRADSETPPNEVEFEMVVPRGTEFPYGTGEPKREWVFGVIIPMAIFLSLGLVAWGWIYKIK